MEVYLSEEERLEALKKWWKDNAKSVVVGALLGVSVILGWNAWRNSQLHKQQEASAFFQQLLKAVETKQVDSAAKLEERIIEKYQGTAYATYATLFSARQKAEAGDLAGAKRVLRDLLAIQTDDNLKNLVRLRLVHVMQALGENEEAIRLIEALKPDEVGEYQTQYEELKGDLYAALQRTAEARVAYEKAKQLGEASPMLELKINDLNNEPVKPAS